MNDDTTRPDTRPDTYLDTRRPAGTDALWPALPQADSCDDAALEATLREALRPVDASAALRARFYAIADQVEAERRARGGLSGIGGLRAIRPRSGSFVFTLPAWTSGWPTGALAALLVLGIAGGGTHLRRAHEQAEATARFELASQIEARTLDQVSAQVRTQVAAAEPPLATR